MNYNIFSFIKKLFFIFVLSSCFFNGYAVQRVWNSTGSTDANNGANYSPTGPLLSTDNLVLNNTSVVSWVQTDSLNVAAISMATTFTGDFSMNGHPLVTSGQCYLNGTTGNWVMDGYYNMTGAGYFYLGNFGTFDGRNGTLDLSGGLVLPGSVTYPDSFSVSKALTYPWKNIYMAKDSFSTVFIYTPCCPGTVFTHQFRIGRGNVNNQNCAYFNGDPDTSYPFQTNSSNLYSESAFYSSCWRSFQINHNNINARTLHFPKMYFGGATQFQIFSFINDTLTFDDTIATPGIRYQASLKTVVNIKKCYLDWAATTLMGNELEFNFSKSEYHTNGFTFSYIGTVNHPVVTFNMDTCSMFYTGDWSMDTCTTFTLNRGLSTVNFITGIRDLTIKSSNKIFYNVTCTTSTGLNYRYTLLDSMTCENKLKIKSKFFAPYSIRTGTFVDSTTDTCKLSSLYISGDAYLSNASKLLWYPGAVIYAVGTGKQTIYTNGNKIVKVVARKGSKLTVK